MNALYASLPLQRNICEFLSILDSARLDRVALDTIFNKTGRKVRGEERPTNSGFFAKKRRDEKCKRVAIRLAFGSEADISGFRPVCIPGRGCKDARGIRKPVGYGV